MVEGVVSVIWLRFLLGPGKACYCEFVCVCPCVLYVPFSGLRSQGKMVDECLHLLNYGECSLGQSQRDTTWKSL